jgi:CysZ protein
MLRALATATDDLLHANVMRYVGIAVLIGVAVFAGVWYGADELLEWWAGEEGTLPAILDWLGALATLVLAWFLFPAVASGIVCLFLDGVANAVERRHWPEQPPPPGVPWLRALGYSLRFLVLLLVVNVLLLGFLLVPPLYPIAWLVGNGWLMGRDYFAVVALRWLEPDAVRALQQRHGAQLLALGIVFALLFTLPLCNLLVPVWATAVMVHRFHRWRDHASPAR